MKEIKLTKEQITAISISLTFSIDNGLLDDYKDTETLCLTEELFKTLKETENK